MKAIVYGPKFPSTSITVDVKEFTKLFKEAGESSVIILKGLDADQTVLIHDIQKDVIKNLIVHADLYVVQKGQKITVHVPLVFTGVSAAVKSLGANLVKVLYEIEVEAEATHLPHEITVDISSLLELEDQILVSDLKVGAGVKILSHETDVVAIASKPVEEVEEPAVLDMSAIEISDQKGKKDDEEEVA
jgi:large subunit ribosomal protein L25